MNILITYDFMTTKQLLGRKLVDKLKFIQKILLALGENIVLDDSNYKSFSIEYLFELMNKSYVPNTFVEIQLQFLNNKSKEYIKSYIEGFDLLITYELSASSRTFFEEEKIKYIDLWMSPIRFHKDIMFCIYSNDINIQKKVQSYKIENSLLLKSANEIKNYCKYIKKDNINLLNNSVLIIGQLFQDKAILKDGRFLTLLDYKDEIKKLSYEHSKIYFLKHPLMTEEEFHIILNEFNSLSNFEYLEEANIYSLLSKNELDSVIAISSSVLKEATFFNKKIKYLYKPVIDESYIDVHDSFFSSSFWCELLNLKNRTIFKYKKDDNYLRYLFNAFYAYEYFLQEILVEYKYSKCLNLFNFCNDLDKNLDYILYGYGSLAKLIAPFLRENIKAIIDTSFDKKIEFVDGFKVIDIDDIIADDNVIVTPFLYQEEIKKCLEKKFCNIIDIKI